jgi:hypothetical protein
MKLHACHLSVIDLKVLVFMHVHAYCQLSLPWGRGSVTTVVVMVGMVGGAE